MTDWDWSQAGPWGPASDPIAQFLIGPRVPGISPPHLEGDLTVINYISHFGKSLGTFYESPRTDSPNQLFIWGLTVASRRLTFIAARARRIR